MFLINLSKLPRFYQQNHLLHICMIWFFHNRCGVTGFHWWGEGNRWGVKCQTHKKWLEFKKTPTETVFQNIVSGTVAQVHVTSQCSTGVWISYKKTSRKCLCRTMFRSTNKKETDKNRQLIRLGGKWMPWRREVCAWGLSQMGMTRACDGCCNSTSFSPHTES